jgi:hypothetical protein
VVRTTVAPWYGATRRIEPAHLYTKPSTTPPARAWAGRHRPGVVGEPAAGCIPSVPPVGGWGRLEASSWPQIRRWDFMSRNTHCDPPRIAVSRPSEQSMSAYRQSPPPTAAYVPNSPVAPPSTTPPSPPKIQIPRQMPPPSPISTSTNEAGSHMPPTPELGGQFKTAKRQLSPASKCRTVNIMPNLLLPPPAPGSILRGNKRIKPSARVTLSLASPEECFARLRCSDDGGEAGRSAKGDPVEAELGREVTLNARRQVKLRVDLAIARRPRTQSGRDARGHQVNTGSNNRVLRITAG